MRSADHPSSPVRRWVLAAYWTCMYLLTHWPEIDRYKPRPDWPFEGSDKVVHAGLYAGWAVLWWWVLSAGGRRVTRAAMGWLFVAGAAYAAFDELTQAIVGRQPDILDFLCDLAGVGTALVILHLLRKRYRLSASRPLRVRPG